MLAAAAPTTSRIRLDTQVTPVPRRRPRQLAREIATLDRLSAGRMILGVGPGRSGRQLVRPVRRAGRPQGPGRDAGRGPGRDHLLWSGEPVSFRGRYVTV